MAKSMRRKNYGLVRADFLGGFSNQYPIDEEGYRKKKSDSLARFDQRHKEKLREKVSPVLLNALMAIKKSNINKTDMCVELGLNPKYFQKNFQRYLKEDDSPKETGL